MEKDADGFYTPKADDIRPAATEEVKEEAKPTVPTSESGTQSSLSTLYFPLCSRYAQPAPISFPQLSKSRYTDLSKHLGPFVLRLDQVTLADQQADPNSPLYSAKSFEELGL